MVFSLKYLTYFNVLEICIDTTEDIQPNRVFISIELKLIQESKHYLSWESTSGKTFHALFKTKVIPHNCIAHPYCPEFYV